MKHYATTRFWRCYEALPGEARDLADRSYGLLKADPTHRSLHLKKIGAVWSVRVGLHHRALATSVGSDMVWFWIGSHAEYDKLVNRKTGKAGSRVTGVRGARPVPRRPPRR